MTLRPDISNSRANNSEHWRGQIICVAEVAAIAGAILDRFLHHAQVIALKGDSYRIKDRDLGRVPTVTADDQ